jgi:hypothetical protein
MVPLGGPDAEVHRTPRSASDALNRFAGESIGSAGSGQQHVA